ncbi:hypothetical protein SAMN05428970_2416 [Agromyces sp. CF514]|uniref:hypothetical protein n=1 Tax=Agromyces sp. CF514 TaxID=1881031 RepID=UPI0008F2D911|nr:hypothetical protein [Agromyces sp. CF514]SFR78658.1 hypothetical protein SAMN05428970_2416 [Agromyces sp. CF514]
MSDVPANAVPAASDSAIQSTDAAASPFTMVTGDPTAMVCEGDVCFIPGASTE